MAELLDIETPIGLTEAVLETPVDVTRPPVLLAHGAGLGKDHEWMTGVRRRLVDAGHPVLGFDYLYMHEGRRAPDRLPKLLAVHEAAAATLHDRFGAMLLVGKSMGGRAGSHLAAEGRCSPIGLVYLGYPLVAMGKTVPRDVGHLAGIDVPQLFVSGTRDRMGPTDAIRSVAGSIDGATAVFIEDGDHSLVPRKSTGRTVDDALDEAIEAVEVWLGAA